MWLQLKGVTSITILTLAVLAGTNDVDDVTTYFNKDASLLLHALPDACYVLATDEPEGGHSVFRLYTDAPLDHYQVRRVNTLFTSDCKDNSSWWLTSQRPVLTSYSDYLRQFAANTTATYSRGDVGRRRHKRGASRAAVRNSGTDAVSPGNAIHPDPYSSPSYSRQTNGHRHSFRHYQTFNDANFSQRGGGGTNVQTDQTNSRRAPQRRRAMVYRIPKRRANSLRKSNEITRTNNHEDTLMLGNNGERSYSHPRPQHVNTHGGADEHQREQHPSGASLIYSQSLGSTGSDGSFHAASEGQGHAGERTQAAVDADSHGAAASASAIKHDQHALAHVQVTGNGGSRRGEVSGGAHSETDQPHQMPVGMNPSQIETMMRQNGYTGFAVAAVSSRRKNNGASNINLGQILPGFSSSSSSSPSSSSSNIDTNKADMVDSIVEQVYNPGDTPVIIDQGGLTGGLYNDHRESEFEQINTGEKLPEGGSTDKEAVGLATHSQNLQGHGPPVNEYDDYYYGYDNYNSNRPMYFPDYDGGVSESLLPVDGSESYGSGIHYPILEGDVPAAENSPYDQHMIVDDTLPSYFPRQPSVYSEHVTEVPLREIHDEKYEGSGGGYGHIDATEGPAPEEPVVAATAEDGLSARVDEGEAQPAYNSIAEYEKTQLIGGAGNRLHTTEPYRHPFDSYIPALHVPQNILPITTDTNSPLDANYIEPSNNEDLEDSDFQYGGDFESSFNASSQVSHVFSHHYTYQHGADSGSIGNSIQSVIPQHVPAGRNYSAEPTVNYPLHVQPTLAQPSSEVHSQNTLVNAQAGNDYNNVHRYSPVRYQPVDPYSNTHLYPAVQQQQPVRPQPTPTDAPVNRHSSHIHPSHESVMPDGRAPHHSQQRVNTPTRPRQHPTPQHNVYSHPQVEPHQTSSDYYSNLHNQQIQSSQGPVHGSHQTQQYHGTATNSHHPTNMHNTFDNGVSMPGVRPSLPSASQGIQTMQNMQVLTPSGLGTVRRITPGNPNLSEIQVIMAEAPTDSQMTPGKRLLPGEKIPGTSGYTVPPGFRGRLVLSSNSDAFSNGMAGRMTQMRSSSMASGLMNAMNMHLSSSSSAQSSGMGGVALASSSSARMTGAGTLSTSSSSSHQLPNGHQAGAPILSYQQSFNSNPMNNNNNNMHPQLPSNGMRGQSWSSWRSSSWRSGGGSMDNNSNNMAPYQNHQLSQMNSAGQSQDCGYWEIKCRIIQNSRQQNEICQPLHIVMPCCC